MKTTELLQRNVLDELAWDASVDSSQIAVTAGDAGVVTLKGAVPTYGEKRKAEKAAKRVAGVRAVVNNIDVVVLPEFRRDDSMIAEAVVDALNWNTSVPKGSVTVAVEKGWVTLEGEVRWQYQRHAAESSVRSLAGVKGVTSLITLKPPQVLASTVKDKIEAAFERSAQIDADHVQVDVDGTAVTLRGNVRSWAEADEAVTAAWSAPGVTAVQNELRVEVFTHIL